MDECPLNYESPRPRPLAAGARALLILGTVPWWAPWIISTTSPKINGAGAPAEPWMPLGLQVFLAFIVLAVCLRAMVRLYRTRNEVRGFGLALTGFVLAGTKMAVLMI